MVICFEFIGWMFKLVPARNWIAVDSLREYGVSRLVYGLSIHSLKF